MNERQQFFSFDLPTFNERAALYVGVQMDDDPESWIHAALPFVSEQEKRHAFRYIHAINRAHHLVGRALVRCVLRKMTQTSVQEEFSYTQYGKPFLQNAAAIDFSISHSGNMIWTAFQKNGSIGIDVEEAKSISDLLEIASKFHPDEYAEIQLASANIRPEIFYRCWVRKESTLKAMGDGLSKPLDSFCVQTCCHATGWLRVSDLSMSENWCTHDIPAVPGYYCSIAAKVPAVSIAILQI